MGKQVPERYRRDIRVDELSENLRIVGDALHLMSKELKQVNAEMGDLKWQYSKITRELEYIKLSPQRKLWQWFVNRWFVRRLRALWLRSFHY